MAHLRNQGPLPAMALRGPGRLCDGWTRHWRPVGAEGGAGEGTAKGTMGGRSTLATTSSERAAQGRPLAVPTHDHRDVVALNQGGALCLQGRMAPRHSRHHIDSGR
jgi:hypothetical protein